MRPLTILGNKRYQWERSLSHFLPPDRDPALHRKTIFYRQR